MSPVSACSNSRSARKLHLPSRKLPYVQPRHGSLFQILHAGDGGRCNIPRRPADRYAGSGCRRHRTRFDAPARQPNGGLTLLGDSFTRLHQTLIADLAGRYRLPSIAPSTDFAKDGGLMDYGPYIGVDGQYRQAATYIDRILKGSKPGDLPVQARPNTSSSA
jgi:ABC transporter substrate binding protein